MFAMIGRKAGRRAAQSAFCGLARVRRYNAPVRRFNAGCYPYTTTGRKRPQTATEGDGRKPEKAPRRAAQERQRKWRRQVCRIFEDRRRPGTRRPPGKLKNPQKALSATFCGFSIFFLSATFCGFICPLPQNCFLLQWRRGISAEAVRAASRRRGGWPGQA